MFNFGFSALPGGNEYGNFNGAGYNGWWWSVTEHNENLARYWSVNYDGGHVTRDWTGKSHGRSVRCVRE